MQNVAIQVNCLKQIVVLANMGSFEIYEFKRTILPEMTGILKEIPHEDLTTKQRKQLTQLKVHSLMNLGKIFKHFDTDTILNEILGSIIGLVESLGGPLGCKEKAVLMSSMGVIDAIGKHLDGQTVAMHVLPKVIPYLVNTHIKDNQHKTISRVCRFMLDKSIGYRTDKASGMNRSSSNSNTNSSGTQFLTSPDRTSVSQKNNAFNFSNSNTASYFNEEKSIFNDNSSFAAFSDLGSVADLNSFFDNSFDSKSAWDIKDGDEANADKLNFVLEEDLKEQDNNIGNQKEYNPFAAAMAEYEVSEISKSQPSIRSPVLFSSKTDTTDATDIDDAFNFDFDNNNSNNNSNNNINNSNNSNNINNPNNGNEGKTDDFFADFGGFGNDNNNDDFGFGNNNDSRSSKRNSKPIGNGIAPKNNGNAAKTSDSYVVFLCLLFCLCLFFTFVRMLFIVYCLLFIVCLLFYLNMNRSF